MQAGLRTLIFGAATALVVSAVVYADQLIGVGGTYWSGRIAATTTSGPAKNVTDAGASTNTLFPAGSPEDYRVVVLTASGVARCGFTTTASATLGAMVWDGGGSRGVGPGMIHGFGAAGEQWHARPTWREIKDLASGWPGICDTALTNNSGEAKVYPPCMLNAHCSGLGAGACVTSSALWTQDQLAHVGVYLVCESDSGTVNVDWHKERIRR